MNPSQDFSIQPIGPVYTIYIGSGPSNIMNDDDRRQIVEICGTRFTSFTYMEARGYFREQFEDTLVIQIATVDATRILHLAHEIAVSRSQLGVGLAGPDARGVLAYQRVIPGRTAIKS